MSASCDGSLPGVTIVEAQARPEFRLYVRYSDGVAGVVDLSCLKGRGIFSAWDDPAIFAAVTIDPANATVLWPGGIDLCSDTLYEGVCAAHEAEPPPTP